MADLTVQPHVLLAVGQELSRWPRVFDNVNHSLTGQFSYPLPSAIGSLQTAEALDRCVTRLAEECHEMATQIRVIDTLVSLAGVTFLDAEALIASCF